MGSDEFAKEIKKIKSIKDKELRIFALHELQQSLESDFLDDMSTIEIEMEFVLDRIPQKRRDELGWDSVSDITQSM